MATKDKLFTKSEGRKYTLTEYEMNYTRDLNGALQMHVLRQRLVAGFLTYLAHEKMGFTKVKKDHNLEFELELAPESDRVLTVREVPNREE